MTDFVELEKNIKSIKESDNEFLITLKDGTPIGSCSCGFDKEFNASNTISSFSPW